VQIVPQVVEPGQFERFAVRVVNQAGPAQTRVVVRVPEVVAVLGTDEPPGWVATVHPVTDSTPAMIEWTGGAISAGAFREFAFLGRLSADARRQTLVFPARVEREDGSVVEWSRGGDGPPPVVAIRGSTTMSSWGAFALAGVATGLAALALALAVSRRRA
jgi:uncharacterized protein YcnI